MRKRKLYLSELLNRCGRLDYHVAVMTNEEWYNDVSDAIRLLDLSKQVKQWKVEKDTLFIYL